jgi:putative ABC transport system ATP-binding protein
MIKTNNIAHSYSKGSEIVFNDISLNQGDQVLIIGNSGCGKTTMLHILSGLLNPSTGNVFINEKNLYEFSSSDLDAFRGKNIGIVFQVHHFVKSLNVEDNLLLNQKLSGLKKDKARVSQVLDRVNLLNKLTAKVFELSEGEKQRISIARALLNSPKIILADEPTSSLDDDSCEGVVDLLKSSAESENATLVIVTHDQRLKNSFSNVINM